jgi:hypothetical protein
MTFEAALTGGGEGGVGNKFYILHLLSCTVNDFARQTHACMSIKVYVYFCTCAICMSGPATLNTHGVIAVKFFIDGNCCTQRDF